jgi:hypothetical protein
MRERNLRLIIVGSVLLVLAIGFFLFMMTLMPQSTDPRTMMQTVGEAAGVVVGISVVMIVLGLIGRKR